MATTVPASPADTAPAATAEASAPIAPAASAAADDAPARQRWLLVAGLLLAMVIIHGIIQSGLPALDKALLDDLGISRGDLKAREAIFFLASGTSSFVVGLVTRRIGPNFIVAGGLLLLSAMLWLYAQTSGITQIYAIYPVLGLCFASVHVVIVVLLIHRNFAKRRALAISIALSGTSMGAAIFPSLVVHLLQTETWRETLTQLSLLPLLALPVLLLLLPRNGYAAARAAGSGSAEAEEGAIRRTPLRLACLLAATFGTFFAATSFLMNMFLYLQDVGMQPESAALGMSAIFVTGLLGKTVVGLCAERWGSHVVWLVQQGILLVGAALLTTGVVAILLPGLVLLGIGWAGCYVMTQVVISEYFAGPKLGQLIGAFFLFEGASSAFGTWLAARLFDAFGTYQVGFLINVLTVALAIGATFVFRRSVARESVHAPSRA
jgi:MFS family permease